MQINCKGKLLDLSIPRIMGILNTTPDSFFSGSRLSGIEETVKKAEKMLNEGADILDIGGMSTRPDSDIISSKEESDRVIPAIEAILKEFPDALISIDTYRAEVAREAINAGAAIINDISAGDLDEKMFETIAELQVPYIMMHMQGTPQTMQKNPVYENVVVEVNQILAEKANRLKKMGVNDIILDPGFGFGKTIAHNYELMKSLDLIGFGEYPILAGVSRKSMIWRLLDITPEEALNGTTVLNTITLEKGASILRVHDVKEARETVRIWEQYVRS